MSSMSLNPLQTSTDRVLITGGTSYLGRRLAARLLAKGASVHIVVRPGSDRSRLDGLPGTPVFHEHDGSSENLIDIVAEAQPSTVFHLATNYLRDHSPAQISDLIADNILFGTQLLEAMRATDVKRLINLGTFFQFHNSDSYLPTNLYAATKQAFEKIIDYYSDAHGISSTTLILYDVYGPGDWRAKLMGAIRDAQAANKPLDLVAADTIMDLVFVEDVVDAMLHTVQENIDGGPWAIRSPLRSTLADVIKTFEQEKGQSITANYGVYAVPPRTPTPPWEGPVLPGWQPQVRLAEGVRRFLSGEEQNAG
ncbi:MAG: NAD(P)-dependent oxidoreductase [Alphaproteobacteria bacterium]|jgi:nucleoside-diphosphate-sugar epimerase|nr:NAD(P)-dependent oxidoreductase [Alphaproteobacteria bacterium]